MENAALVTIARNCPNMIRFCVCLVKPQSPDYLTLGPLDAGFDAIASTTSSAWRSETAPLAARLGFQELRSSGHETRKFPGREILHLQDSGRTEVRHD
ncbi:hypothetical protein BC332_34605 [Capsicum chinense]|nr:hypothetical protein BC332_34605 [Capsicum chinense]